MPALPVRRPARRRDRHGRGIRGPLLPPTSPAGAPGPTSSTTSSWTASSGWSAAGARLTGVEFAVEEVPPSDPAPWEHRSVALGRYFPADPAAGLSHRIVVYRRPVTARCATDEDLEDLVDMVVVEQVAAMLGRAPEEIDPDYPAED